MVPVTPWNEEAVPAIGAILVIASVPKFDVVNAKATNISSMSRTNNHKGSAAKLRHQGMQDRDDDKCDQPGMAGPPKPNLPTTRELPQLATAIGAAMAAKISPISGPDSNTSNTICWIEDM